MLRTGSEEHPSPREHNVLLLLRGGRVLLACWAFTDGISALLPTRQLPTCAAPEAAAGAWNRLLCISEALRAAVQVIRAEELLGYTRTDKFLPYRKLPFHCRRGCNRARAPSQVSCGPLFEQSLCLSHTPSSITAYPNAAEMHFYCSSRAWRDGTTH